MKDNAVSTERIIPRQRTFLVAYHVTAAALEAIFVVKYDAAIGSWHEEICWADNNALTGWTRIAYRRINRDMGRLMHAKFNRLHSVLERDRAPLLRLVDQISISRHPKLLNPA